MDFQVSNLVTRYSYNHDIVFKIASIENGIARLKGKDVRLEAHSPLDDLRLYEKKVEITTPERRAAIADARQETERRIKEYKITRINQIGNDE
jgi:hypothetical protein